MFSSLTDVGSHNPPPSKSNILAGTPLVSTPFEAQPPRSTSPGVGSNTICNSSKATTSLYCSFWTFSSVLPLKIFKTHLLGRGFHTLIKNDSFSSVTDVGSHNPPLFRAQRLHRQSFPSPIDVRSHNPPLFRAYRPRWHSFPSQIDVELPNLPLHGPTSLLAYHFVSSPSELSLLQCLTLIPFVGSQILFSLGFPFRTFRLN